MDVFPKTPFPNFKLNQIQDVAVNLLSEKCLHNGEEFIQGIIDIYEAIMSRHGVMIVGEAMSGKSKVLQIMIDVMNLMHAAEVKVKIRDFMIEKAERMGVETKKNEEGNIVPKNRDPHLESKNELH